jgi:hypothetical protein
MTVTTGVMRTTRRARPRTGSEMAGLELELG